MAMTAAETGHLVLGTLHTTGAVKTIDRIIDALPVEEREQTKSFLSQSLIAVITQVLVKTADGQGRKAICEVMVMTKAIAKLIQTDQTHQMPEPAADGQASSACRCWTRRCWPRCRRGRSIPTTPTATPRTRRPLQKFVTDTSLLPKLDVGRRRRRRLIPGRRLAPHGRDRRTTCRKSCSGAARTCTSSPATRRASACTAT